MRKASSGRGTAAGCGNNHLAVAEERQAVKRTRSAREQPELRMNASKATFSDTRVSIR